MKKTRIVQSIILIAVITLMIILAMPVPYLVDIKDTDVPAFVSQMQHIYTDDELTADSTWSSKRLIVKRKHKYLNLHGYNAKSVTNCNRISIMEFETEQDLKDTYDILVKDSKVDKVYLDHLVVTTGEMEQVAMGNGVVQDTEESITYVEQSDTVVAVIDSGYTISAHNEQYSNRVLRGADFTGSNSISDKNGHGTLMSDIILSTTPENVKILPVKVADKNGISSISQLFTAILFATDNGADIINISMSAMSLDDAALMESACEYAKNHGVIVITCAGNEATDTNFFTPACVRSILTVASVTKDKELTAYTNFGESVDLVAYGAVNIDGVNSYGTSVSAAIASSALANTYNKDMGYQQNVDRLLNHATFISELAEAPYDCKGHITVDGLTIIEDAKSERTYKESLLGCDWKNLSDAELNEIMFRTSDNVMAYFVQRLKEADLTELLSRKTLLMGEVEYIDTIDGVQEYHLYKRLYDRLKDIDISKVEVQATDVTCYIAAKHVWNYEGKRTAAWMDDTLDTDYEGTNYQDSKGNTTDRIKADFKYTAGDGAGHKITNKSYSVGKGSDSLKHFAFNNATGENVDHKISVLTGFGGAYVFSGNVSCDGGVLPHCKAELSGAGGLVDLYVSDGNSSKEVSNAGQTLECTRGDDYVDDIGVQASLENISVSGTTTN